jgi:hypothetical protein
MGELCTLRIIARDDPAPLAAGPELFVTAIDRKSGNHNVRIEVTAESGPNIVRIGTEPPWHDPSLWSKLLRRMARLQHEPRGRTC